MTYAYIDESGNTGHNMFDPGQPALTFPRFHRHLGYASSVAEC